MGWKKMILGEKMPDKDDPKYKEQYEKEVAAGRKFAQITKIDKAAAKVQTFANTHTKAFLIIVFGFLFVSFGLNLYRMGKVYVMQQDQKSAIIHQDNAIRNRHNRLHKAISSAHTMTPGIDRVFQDTINQNNKDNGYSDTKKD